ISDERAILCTPGNVDEFVRGVVWLVEQPGLSRALGRNARLAAAAHYSWARHVANLWHFAAGGTSSADVAAGLRRKPPRPAAGGTGAAPAVAAPAAPLGARAPP